MTVKEFFENQYKAFMLKVDKRTWETIKNNAQNSKMSIPDYIMFNYCIIYNKDIVANGGWGGELYKDLLKWHSEKLVASNKHVQFYGKKEGYWLTKKGLKMFK